MFAPYAIPVPRKEPLSAEELAIGQRLRQYRERLRLSRVAFAAETGCDTDAITRVEHGRTPLLCKLAWQLKHRWPINPHWLVTGEGEPISAVPLPRLGSLPISPTAHFSAAYRTQIQSRLVPIIQSEGALSPQSASQLAGVYEPSARGRLEAEANLTQELRLWLLRVPDANLNHFIAALRSAGEHLLASYPNDKESIAAVMMRSEEIARLRKE